MLSNSALSFLIRVLIIASFHRVTSGLSCLRPLLQVTDLGAAVDKLNKDKVLLEQQMEVEEVCGRTGKRCGKGKAGNLPRGDFAGTSCHSSP